MIFKFLSTLLLTLVLSITPALAAVDARMQVEVMASDEEGSSLNELHANIQHAATLALPMLWNRMLPQDARNAIPKKVNALLFMQGATPTDRGVSITFNEKRVIKYLKAHELPYIEQQPSWDLSIQLRNASGKSMVQSTSLLQAYAGRAATNWGYKLDESGDSLVLHWRWMDQKQVSLVVRGTSRLGEFSETRRLRGGDPVPQLQQWLTEILLRARDAHIAIQEEPVIETAPVAIPAITTEETPQPDSPLTEPLEQLLPVAQNSYLLLNIERQASLPEQVLFEDDLKRDPRIINLSLRQVNRDMQQYRLLLKGSDDQWLVEWFGLRGLKLSPTLEGWVARLVYKGQH